MLHLGTKGVVRRISMLSFARSGFHSVLATIALVFIAPLVPSILWTGAQAATGDLDPTFGDGGKVTTRFYPDSFNEAYAIAQQLDGKIVAGGTVWQGFDTYDFALARYNPDGTLDFSFGEGGKVATNFFVGSSDGIRGIAIQQDQKIVAVGSAGLGSFDFAVARYNVNGTLDESFGLGGKTRASLGSLSFAKAVVIQPDGKIVVVGDGIGPGTGFDFAVVRFKNDGSIDYSFGFKGRVTIDFRGFDNRASAVVLQS